MLKNKVMIAPLGLAGITILSGVFLMSSITSATDNTDVVDEINITVPVSCSLSGTGMTSHNANIVNGTYQADIGSTTLKAFCNDTNGFAIYAAGYTGDDIGTTNSNKLVGTPASIGNIDTGTATSGDTSNWAMKLATDSNATYAITLDNGFGSYSSVPNSYTKVAHRDSGTDIGTTATGASLTSTYAAFMSQTQPAGTYSGQVIYTLVHPSDHAKPVAHPAILDTGQTVNAKLKSLAATVVNGEETIISPNFNPNENYDSYYGSDSYIKSINIHLETPTPAGFTPTEMNTISSSASIKPIYIVFDNTDDTGVMHFYTEGDQIVLSSDSSFMFYTLNALADLSDISNWDTSNVINMSYMFYVTGQNASSFTLDLSSWNTSSVMNMSYMLWSVGSSAPTWSIGDLSSWDTSNVMNMNSMLDGAGWNATTWSIGDLSSWDTSSVTDMSRMFSGAGYSATAWSVGDLSSWDISSVTDTSNMFYRAGFSASTWSIGDISSWKTSSVTNMNGMFSCVGYSSTTWSIGDISSWNTSSVTSMNSMFSYAGYSATTFTLDLSSWNTSSVTSMKSMFSYAGYSATTFTLDLSSWNTSNVTSMNNLFANAGPSASTWSVTIPQTNGDNISNTTSRFYGKTTSTYGAPPSGKSFTLAQP